MLEYFLPIFPLWLSPFHCWATHTQSNREICHIKCMHCSHSTFVIVALDPKMDMRSSKSCSLTVSSKAIPILPSVKYLKLISFCSAKFRMCDWSDFGFTRIVSKKVLFSIVFPDSRRAFAKTNVATWTLFAIFSSPVINSTLKSHSSKFRVRWVEIYRPGRDRQRTWLTC